MSQDEFRHQHSGKTAISTLLNKEHKDNRNKKINTNKQLDIPKKI
jgi:hypothetical protein